MLEVHGFRHRALGRVACGHSGGYRCEKNDGSGYEHAIIMLQKCQNTNDKYATREYRPRMKWRTASIIDSDGCWIDPLRRARGLRGWFRCTRKLNTQWSSALQPHPGCENTAELHLVA